MAQALRASTRPPGGFAEVTTWELSTSDDLARIRRSLHAELLGRGEEDSAGLGDLQDRVVLVVSELATNALRHGAPPSSVRLLVDDARALVVDVTDAAAGASPELAAARALGEGGFGMHLAARLADGVGWYTDAELKHVWARFAFDGPDTDARAATAVPAV
ncbi:ATP-binding protein [uncultured Pseudokineococcus sp.]|uniref:ATP-binding protein n=1 Tax=uncultured Pseudokineococcus sp. TaxID=1642928 RepID=UPI0026082CE9|nr:ATP-binding protein [uncultured Pseudokineococcus sp.]